MAVNSKVVIAAVAAAFYLWGCESGGADASASAAEVTNTSSGSTSANTTATKAAAVAGAQTLPVLSSGLMVGAFTGGSDPISAGLFEAWLGRKSDFNVEFLTDAAFTDYVRSDGTVATDSLMNSEWFPAKWASAKQPGRNMLFSIPLTTKQDPYLANVAAGVYDHVFIRVAKAIAKHYPKAIIRIGWEFNGNWYPWSAAGKTQDYINAFRRVSKIFTSASSTFTIDWCPTSGVSANNFPSEDAYPGDDVVDVIGLDLYNDYRWGAFKEDPVKRWEWLRTYGHGLQWQLEFATAHKKKMSLPEWGVNRDDPYFIEQVYKWVTAHNFAYVSYWNSNSAFTGTLSNGQYPNAAATYKRLFGSIPVKQK
jgi:hypothetical protein